MILTLMMTLNGLALLHQTTLTKQSTDTSSANDTNTLDNTECPSSARPDHTYQTDHRDQLMILTLMITLNCLALPDQTILTKQTTDTSSWY